MIMRKKTILPSLARVRFIINILSMSCTIIPRSNYESPATFILNSRKSLNLKESRQTFIPFVRERDAIGKLIKDNNRERDISPLQLKKQGSHGKLSTEISRNNTPRVYQAFYLKTDLVDQTINHSFQFKQPVEHKQPKGKITRKNSLQLPQHKPSKQKIHLPTIQSPEKLPQINQMAKRIKKKMFTQPESEQQRQPTLKIMKPARKASLNVREHSPEVICSKATQNQPNIIINEKKNDTNQREAYISPDLNIKLSKSYITNVIKNREISQLNRYSTFKTLSLKLTNTYQVGHSTFILKMQQSKKLSYQLKMGLQAT